MSRKNQQGGLFEVAVGILIIGIFIILANTFFSLLSAPIGAILFYI